jgi:hypothetical protein
MILAGRQARQTSVIQNARPKLVAIPGSATKRVFTTWFAASEFRKLAERKFIGFSPGFAAKYVGGSTKAPETFTYPICHSAPMA